MKKNIISIILSISFLMSGISVFAEVSDAEVNNDEALSNSEQAETENEAIETADAAEEEIPKKIRKVYEINNYNFLNSLGFTSDLVSENADDYITRREFAILSSKLLNVDCSLLSGDKSSFDDVLADSKGYNEINALSSFGIIGGKAYRMFYPDDLISLNEAATVITRICGHDVYVEDGNYLKVAVSQGILKNVVSESPEKITIDNAYQMINNALFSDFIERDLSVGNPKYELSNKNILEGRFKIFKIEGIVEDDGVISLNGNTTIDSDEIVIGNTRLYNKTGKSDLIGYNTEGYYQEVNDEFILKYISVIESKVACDTLDAELIDDFDGTAYKAYENESSSKAKSYKLEKNNRIVYNGKVFSGNGYSHEQYLKMMTPESGYVRLVDNNNNGKYDTIIVKNYHHLVVKAADLSGKAVTCMVKPNDEFKPQKHKTINGLWNVSFNDMEDEDISIYDAFGNEITFNYIKSDVCLSVAMSADVKKAEIILSNDKIESTGSAIINDDNVRVENKEYSFTDEYKSYFSTHKPTSGLLTKYYLTFDKKIAYSTLERSDEINYVFLQKAYLGDDDKLIAKIFTMDNTFAEVPVAEKVTINGNRYTSWEDTYSYLNSAAINAIDNGEGKYRGNIVIVKYNSNGEISNIDLPYGNGIEHNANEMDDSWHIVDGLFQSDTLSREYEYENCAADYDTVIFVISSDGKEMAVTQKGSKILFPVTTKYTTTAYQFLRNNIIVDAIAVYIDSETIGIDIKKIPTAANPAVVMEVSKAVNTLGENCAKLKLLYMPYKDSRYEVIRDIYTASENGAVSNGGNSSIKVKEGQEVKVGDVIKYGTNAYGIIPDGQLTIMYSPTSDTLPYYYNGSLGNQNQQSIATLSENLYFTTIESYNDIYIRLKQNYNNTTVYKNCPFTTALYMVFEDGEVTLGDFYDLESAYVRGENVVVFQSPGDGKNMITFYIVRD